ncbi:hypothetical protein DFH07DRAFT_1011479 [Mycena maculata]|uniref:Uncharacterized protein n=1 Tax=Mycena maculata TaxID=230809 RepID=A0AAD7HFQ6_9AGAR|nr:hypothetical protein DFH07DRAFT_1011479 [Mycena maculata]
MSPKALLDGTSFQTNSNYSDGGLTGGEFDPYEETHVPPRTSRLVDRGIFFHLIRWPALVIFGQLGLQALGWGFLVAVKHRGPLALPFSTAVWAANNPHLVTLTATLISTLLAACSSFFFSYALRRSMSLYLLRPMSLAALGASVNISMRSLVFHRRNWKWPAVSLLCFIMAGIQTSVWSTLITPVKVVISTPLVGREIDLSSPILQQLSDANALTACQTAESDMEVYGGVPESGYANGQAYLGLPAAVSLLGQGFNVSTRGILAATLNDTHVGSWYIPATAQSVDVRPSGISNSYSMIQQGFSADVSCTLQNLTQDTSLSVWSETDFVQSWNANVVAQPNITYIIAHSNCSTSDYGMNITDAYVKASGEYLWAIGCDPLPEAPNNYTLILQSSGNYTTLTGPGGTSYLVCQIAPKTTVIQADYDGDINATVQSVNRTTANAGGTAGAFAMYIITDLVWHQQGMTVNSVADQLLELSDNVAAERRLEVVEQYLKGVVEYSASILRACLSAQNLAFSDGVPLNITMPTNGTWETETMGWKDYAPGTILWILIPGFFMASSTLALTLIAVYRHGAEMYRDTNTFDPSNPLHMIRAAAAGGLQNAFKGLREEDINEGEKFRVVLVQVPGLGPALVRADEYTPISLDTSASRAPSSLSV